MNVKKLAVAVVAAAALAACGKKAAEPAKPAAPAAAAAATPAADAPKDGAKAEEHTDAPDVHGMPGMSNLFQGKDEKKQ